MNRLKQKSFAHCAEQEWTVSDMRLINEIAYQERLAKIPMEERTFRKAVEIAEDMPTIDAVPVVRCKDCGNHSESNGNHYCKFWRMYCPDDADFFCKAGKRKDGA